MSYVPDARNPYADLERDGEPFRMLGVAPEARGAASGRPSFVAASPGLAQRVGAYRDLTVPTMEAAHRLYERLGFRRAPDRDHIPVPGVQLWAYVLSLTP